MTNCFLLYIIHYKSAYLQKFKNQNIIILFILAKNITKNLKHFEHAKNTNT